tara:strand:+ start:1251 stop:1490 length:240 start_codon:yes stop_codon:yes gene_type:complete
VRAEAQVLAWFEALRVEEPGRLEGATRAEAQAALACPDLNAERIDVAIAHLVEQGDMYSTIDEAHFAAVPPLTPVAERR